MDIDPEAGPAGGVAIGRVPVATRRAALLVSMEGGLLLLAGVWLAVAILTRDETDLGMALSEVGVSLAVGAGLVALGRWLARGVRAARSPVVVTQLLALPVGWTLLGAGRIALGVLVAGFALSVLALLLLVPESRHALDRTPRSR